jgi:predicted permease
VLSVRLACALYRRALRRHLDAGAQRFAEPMLQTFRSLCRRRRAQRSAPSVLLLALAETIDLARSAREARARHHAAGRDHPRNAFGTRKRGALAWTDGLGADLRLAARALRRRPTFVLAALVTLVVGIGSTTAIFTVLDNVLIRPLPFPQSDRLVELWSWELAGSDGMPGVSADLRRAWREQTDIFDAIEVFDEGKRVLVGDDDPEQISVALLTPGLFELLGGQPVMGRPIVAADAAADAQPVALLSEGLWKRRFGADPDVVGEIARLDDTSYEVIGVMPRSFAFPARDTDVWIPLARDAAGYAIARLAPGVTIEAAQHRVEQVAPRFAAAGLAPEGWGLMLFSLRDSFLFDIGVSARRAIWMMFGAVCMLLLIAASNVAGLMLSQATGRRQELAVRAALGAGRGRIVRQLMIEAGLLGTCAALVGSGCALATVRLAVRFAPDRLNFLVAQPIVVDARILAFALAVALGSVFLFAILPALHATRPGHAMGPVGGHGHSASSGQQRLRAALVVAELAIAAVLLVGAGLLVRSMSALLHTDPGFDTGVTVVTVNPSPGRYGEEAAQRLLVTQLEELATSLPGVEAAAVSSGAPPFRSSLSSANHAEAEGQPPPAGVYRGDDVHDASQVVFLNIVNVTDDYFRALGIPLLDGRSFAPDDASADVAIISEDFARRYWHGASPVGRRLRLREGRPWLTVLGVVPEVLQTGLDARRGEIEIYYPMAQSAGGYPRLYLILRGELDADALLPALRRGLRSIDPQLPVSSVASMAELLSDDLAGPRFNMLVLVAFAAVALLLAAVGVYGVLAYNVVRRTREIGVRMALGARRADVVRGVVGRGMLLATIGLALGGAGAWGLTRFIRSLLSDVEPLDPATLVVTAGILLAVALLACIVPAARATRVDPLVALRHE